MKFIRHSILTLLSAWVVTAQAVPQLDGVWVLYKAEQFAQPVLTAEGQKLKDAYDFKTGDPSLQCIPASWTRVYSNPNTPIDIRLTEDRLSVRYELFDITRDIPISKDPGHAEYVLNNPNFPTLGESAAWFDGDVLVIDTINYHSETGVLSTIRNWAGLPQSPLLRTIERYTRKDDTTLLLEITHIDAKLYAEPLKVSYALTFETRFGVLPYGCTPENATITTVN